MKHTTLLLTENVDNLGIVGDVVEVKPGFARNFLIPRGIGIEPSQGNIARLAERRKQVEAELKAERERMVAMLEKLEDYELTIERSANEQGVLFGGVSQHDIADAMQAEGFAIDDRMVRIGQQIKRLDSYEVPIVLARDLKASIKLWVVSDKPMEDLDADEDEAAGEEAPAPEAADDTSEEATKAE